MTPLSFDEFFQDAPPAVPVEAVRQAWQSLSADYDVEQWRLPLPLWARRPYDHHQQATWPALQRHLADYHSPAALCIYLHVPFCTSKCGFCDSYSFRLRTHQDERVAEYIHLLCAELAQWSRQGNLSQRPVSTVHFGGGTPGFLGADGLAQLVDGCQELFATQPDTEWALETTVESLTPEMVEALHALGFRRLHVGVQSLEPAVRAEIGRRRPPAEVLERIQAVRSLGWVVSVDLLCGLPYQTLAGYMAGIEQLLQVGVDGFSLYELLIYPQNQRWAAKNGLLQRSHLPNYWLFQAGAALLSQRGLEKNLFNHWANQRDANVYFTFPTRGEDCLAVGTIADGVFGRFHYRHLGYKYYLSQLHAGQLGLEGGLLRTEMEDAAQSLATAILSSRIPSEALSLLRMPGADGRPPVERWLANGLVVNADQGGLQLTDGGAWFAGNLVAEANQAILRYASL